MNDLQRKALFEALLGDVSMFAPEDLARRTLEEAALRQLEAIEPLVEAMLNEAWRGGLLIGLEPLIEARLNNEVPS